MAISVLRPVPVLGADEISPCVARPHSLVLDATNSLDSYSRPPSRRPNPSCVVLSRPAACGGARDGRCMPQGLRAWQKPVLSFFGRKDKRNLFSDILVLKRDMYVLAEFKHYVATGSFVPADCCYRIQGYSAEQLCRTTCLTPLGAFNYLIYLQERPEEALANLKAGLPRR